MGNIPRSYAAGAFALTLDGVDCGLLRSAAGGDTVGEVVTATAGPGQFAEKHLGSVRYEDIVLELGMGMGSVFYDWIDASWQLDHQRKGGSILAAGADFSIQSEQTFADALISEVTFPKLDATSKEAAFLTVKLAPERVAFAKGSGKLPASRASKQKLWTAANFRLDVDGLDAKQVTAIDAFTVKQTVAVDDIGERRHLAEPSSVEFPNLKITLSAASAASWSDWFDDFVVKGNNGADRERSGSIAFLAPDRTELARVELSNVGIFALRRSAGGAAKEQVARVVAELYCERMSLKIGG